MKKFKYQNCALLIVALAVTAFLTSGTSGAATREQPGTNAGRLIIRRAANLGTGLFLGVSIDDVKVTELSMSETYDAPLSPGQHVISVILRPNQLFLRPTQKTLNVETGKTYAFTAMWQGQTVVLR